MKKVLSFITVFMLFTSININAINAEKTSESELLADQTQTCFSFYHGIFHEYYGGINLDNLGDFNDIVHQCQIMFE